MSINRVNEKYRRQISAVVDSIAALNQWWDALTLGPFDSLVKSVAQIHNPWLSERDANMALLNALADCIESFDLRAAGWPLPAALEAEVRRAIFGKFEELITSLPWSCEVKFPLPRFDKFGQYELEISDAISIRYGLAEPSHDGTGINSLFLSALPRGQHSQLCIKVRGYADSDPAGNAVSQAVSLAKQCLYFLATFSTSNPLYGSAQLEETYAVIPQGRVTIRLPDTLSRYFCGLTPRPDALQVFRHEKGTSLLSGALRPAISAEERAEGLTSNLQIAKQFFSLKDHPDYRSVGAAIEWYIDSITADNQTFAYIAACIGLEAILGLGADDKEKMEAMSSRLSDRYGFLLGVGRADREKLSRQYGEMLKLRGKLVHARLNRLNADERSKLYEVQDMLAKVIGREITTLIRAANAVPGLFRGAGM